ncbi:MAG TPA: GGDEF domain-containing protein [Acidimicrobiales bacterium]
MDRPTGYDAAVPISESQSALADSQVRVQRMSSTFLVLGTLLTPVIAITADMIGSAFVDGPRRYIVSGAVLLAIVIPLGVSAFRVTLRQQRDLADTMARLEQQLTSALAAAEQSAQVRESEIRRQDFEARLANALEMAEGENEVLEVVERAFQTTIPESPAELLLADNSHAHMSRMAVSAPFGDLPLCSVDSPDHCPAARRGQTQVFADSEAIDACPKLRDHPNGPCSAVCIPVSVMGRAVGVIHTTDAPRVSVGTAAMQDLGTLAKLAGARIGLLRVMAETQVQASTDSLTGLLNRRAFENAVRNQHAADEPMAVAMADLDRFKALNDTYGHETGDRALRAFAQALRSSVRHDDLVARHGGEEFAVVLPGCTADAARKALEKVRDDLPKVLRSAGLPAVTASFGIVVRESGEDLASCLARADVALFQAKHDGRDRIVAHDGSGSSIEDLDPDLLEPDYVPVRR